MKELILQAIQKLVISYGNNTIMHLLQTCPLCRVFIGNINCEAFMNYDIVNHSCKGCPNQVFISSKNPEFSPCIQRGDLYPELDYFYSFNNRNLSDFWGEVYILLVDQSEEDILNMPPVLKSEMIKIAEKYNNSIDERIKSI